MAEAFSYERLDAAKRYAQEVAQTTEGNIGRSGYRVVSGSRGESAFLLEGSDHYLALVQEGLGTKNLVAQKTDAPLNGVAWDTVAMVVNDLITSGAYPMAVNAHWAVGSSDWLTEDRAKELADGWKDACNEAGAVYGAGETPALAGIVYPQTIELSGSGVGVIKPKLNYVHAGKLEEGDHIVLVESSGIHANGLTKAREIAEKLADGYDTKLGNGKTYGESILTPTHIYAKLQRAVLEDGTDIHYMSNITGHGWRKLMRPERDFTYRMHTIAEPQEEFDFIQHVGEISDEDMYATFNMGVGFAFYVPERDALNVQTLATKQGFRSWDAGLVERGPRQVIIEPKDLIYTADTLQIR
jgi:phosphoribosylformylglycinamidine cyclo-ligase